MLTLLGPRKNVLVWVLVEPIELGWIRPGLGQRGIVVGRSGLSGRVPPIC